MSPERVPVLERASDIVPDHHLSLGYGLNRSNGMPQVLELGHDVTLAWGQDTGARPEPEAGMGPVIGEEGEE